jgi:hypothetical protein
MEKYSVDRPKTSDGPDLIQPVIGFRAWTIEKDEWLRSRGAGNTRWDVGTNEAKCGGRDLVSSVPYGLSPGPTDHDAPDRNCECGFYAIYSLRDLVSSYGVDSDVVIGAVVAWGRMEVHASGFRAQLARIVALGVLDTLALYDEGYADKVAAIARLYNAECVPLLQLEEVAGKHGIEMPEDVRPASSAAEDMAAAFRAMARTVGASRGMAGPSGRFRSGGAVASGISHHHGPPPAYALPLPPPPAFAPIVYTPPPAPTPKAREVSFARWWPGTFVIYVGLVLGFETWVADPPDWSFGDWILNLGSVAIGLLLAKPFVHLQRRIRCLIYDWRVLLSRSRSPMSAHSHYSFPTISSAPVEGRCERCGSRVDPPISFRAGRAARAFASAVLRESLEALRLLARAALSPLRRR